MADIGIRIRNSALMLDNRDGSLLDGAVIEQWTGNGLAPHRWRLEPANQKSSGPFGPTWR